ncbi:hypothetical protein ACFWBR_08045 [Streptomyces sp. NPDC060006]|uniref:hypothetical protein n=1 Tax=unclassified Streptomyces TaxID=2593676 RepID=UPI0036A05301
MRIVNVHHAWAWPSQTRKAMVTLGVIIIVGVSVAAMAGHGTAALTVIVMAVLTVAAEELLRAALRYWLRVV